MVKLLVVEDNREMSDILESFFSITPEVSLCGVAHDGEEAIAKMKRALYEFVIEGVDTNIEYQNKILNNKKFEKCQYNTSFLENVKL